MLKYIVIWAIPALLFARCFVGVSGPTGGIVAVRDLAMATLVAFLITGFVYVG